MINFQTELEYKKPGEPCCKRHFVAAGTSHGFEYYVANLGGQHPCAYVVLPKGHRFNGWPYGRIPIECHGGLTYGQPRLEGVTLGEGEYVIGWDYAHWDDYIAAYGVPDNQKKWTTGEIVSEVINVCEQLVKEPK